MFRKVKKLILASCLFVIILVAGTLMWDMHQIDVENILQSRTVEVEINEVYDSLSIEAGEEVKKEVSFDNTGTASVFLRFTYAEYWESDSELLEGYADSTTLNWTTNEDGTVFFNSEDWWYDAEDGWYYYGYVVTAGSSIDILDSVTFNQNIPSDAEYNLFFQVETVQVSDEDSVNLDATKELFGVTATQ